MQSAEALRIVLLEDDPDDAARVERELRKRDLRFAIRRVDTRDEFVSALAEAPPDVILADHALPAFSGLEALRIARESRPGIPFLFVSGHIGEDRAIEALKEGATDYILKDNLERLGPAVERAVRERGGRVLAEESLRMIFESALDAVVTMGADGRVSGWNTEAERVFGWTAAEAIGRPLADLIIPERYRESHRRGLRQFLQSNEGPILSRRIEIEALHRDGHEFEVELSVAPLRTPSGPGFSAFLRDITDRKRAQARLAAEHAVDRILAEAPSFERSVSQILEALCRILGWDLGAYWVPDVEMGVLVPAEFHACSGSVPPPFIEASRSVRFGPGVGLLGRAWQERGLVWSGDLSRDLVPARADAARQVGYRGMIAFAVLHDDEVFGIFEFWTRATLQPDLELFEVIRSIGRHIGQALSRRRAENANWLRTERAERLREALLLLAKTLSDDLPRTLARVTETVSDLLEVERASVWRFNDDRSELVCEDLFLRSAGAHERGLSLRQADYPRYFGALEASRVVSADDAGQDPRTSEFREGYLGPLGITSMMDVPIRLGGKVVGVVCHEHTGRPRRWTGEEENFASSAADLVTLAFEAADRRKAEGEVLRLNRDLERRVAERTAELDSFAYSVAHDLRAPLRSMRGFSEALLEDYAPQLPSEGRDYALRISKAAARMNALIEDLLAYSRLAREHVALAPLDLDDVLRSVIEEMASELLERKAQVTVEKPLLRVIGHPVILQQVFQNLLSNAIKFVAPGTAPQVRIRAEGAGGRVRIWVEDNGIGVAPEHHDRIFRVFERLHSIEDYPGTGIGLAIVRKALDRMSGTSGVDSAPGRGSRFWIELPAG